MIHSVSSPRTFVPFLFPFPSAVPSSVAPSLVAVAGGGAVAVVADQLIMVLPPLHPRAVVAGDDSRYRHDLAVEARPLRSVLILTSYQWSVVETAGIWRACKTKSKQRLNE